MQHANRINGAGSEEWGIRNVANGGRNWDGGRRGIKGTTTLISHLAFVAAVWRPEFGDSPGERCESVYVCQWRSFPFVIKFYEPPSPRHCQFLLLLFRQHKLEID